MPLNVVEEGREEAAEVLAYALPFLGDRRMGKIHLSICAV